MDPRLVVDAPSGGVVGLSLTFRWHLERPVAGRTYRYEVRLDKGVNACDDAIEQAFQAETRTCLALDLPAATYGDQRVEFAVRTTDSSGRTVCSPGPTLTISATAPPSPTCGL